MNKAITDGLVLTPPAFELGLDVWSSENGTSGSATYDGASNAAIAIADQDFGNCLELTKSQTTQKLRSMGQTPLLPGCYLRVRTRVKAISGNLPSVRIAGYAMTAGDVHVSGLVEIGETVALSAYGTVVEVEAIVGTGARGGVDMVWGMEPAYGHFGLDLTGLNGGIVRIENFEIEDITEAYLRDMLDWVDVRDYGALGDGVTDDREAFVAADAAAGGRAILVPEGSYYIGSTLSINAPIRFEGTLVMPVAARLALLSSYDFPTYAEAFGDEMEGFKRALQALLGYTDHNTLDLKGRRVEVTEPIRIAEIAPDVTTFSNRRVLRNGQLNVIDGAAWADQVVVSLATYNTAQPYELTGVANVANVPVGALITGSGVGREVYVKAKNLAAQSLTISQPLYGGSGTRNLTFRRFQYVLDFSGMGQLDRFNIDDVEFLCNGVSSAILLAPAGQMFHLRDSYVVKPKDRVITSIGRGCQDLLVDRCQFISNEASLPAQDRISLAINVNANDTKIRDSRFVRFGTTFVMHGSGHLLVGNHWFQGDDEDNNVRLPGLVFTELNVQSAVTGNYIDSSIIEWTNEHDPAVNFASGYSFGGLTVSGNTCVAMDSAAWFTFFSVKPYGTGHFIHGLSISDNVFKAIDGNITRIDKVDTTYADLDYSRMRNIRVEGNMFNGITEQISNPVSVEVNQSTAQSTWTVDPSAYLPFNGWARNVESLVAEGAITNASGVRVTGMPYVNVEQGTNKDQVQVVWPEAAKGRLQMRIRMDNPN
ncbi:MAG: glycosyl hydrolase family 28-related protein [Paracoccaceae bacterium]